MAAGQPKPHDLRAAIADSVAEHVKAYDVAESHEGLGLAPVVEGEDPFRSKRIYVQSKLTGKPMAELRRIAGRLLEEWNDPSLQTMVDGLAARGVRGEVRNLIFASTGPKPKIVLRDAIDNVVEVVENGQFCLYYDRPVSEGGLMWSELVDWWSAALKTANTDVAARHRWTRLHTSLDSDPEKTLFRSYTKRYQAGFDQPALIPQVYLHYDPYSSTGGRRSALVRQRMDFLLLLPGRRRVVIEIDGKHHYARPDGTADPAAYAAMMAEDRRLRLRGYEVHRFGGWEFVDNTAAHVTLDAFFDELLDGPT
ncbi:hypothetical protein [Frankia sp. CiP3]|uniref:hypothetical protein n=1 Tax=Frankia sp. CiP3 TaxID=2880971 RepID=UPI001EF3D661|nr:hypothetical protein [Frankia sp. CiP3]